MHIELPLDTRNDISIINVDTWKKIGKSVLRKTVKSARSMTGKKLHFIDEMWTNVTFRGKICKAKVFVIENATTLFGTNWLELFDL